MQLFVGKIYVLISWIIKSMTLLFHFTGGQYLIAGGGIFDGDYTKTTEVVELVMTNSTPSFGQLPSSRSYAVGAMFGNAPILCGGWDGSSDLDSCISFQNSQWSQSHSMNEKRGYPAGVQINSTTFWILGGWNGSSDLDTSDGSGTKNTRPARPEGFWQYPPARYPKYI